MRPYADRPKNSIGEPIIWQGVHYRVSYGAATFWIETQDDTVSDGWKIVSYAGGEAVAIDRAKVLDAHWLGAGER